MHQAQNFLGRRGDGLGVFKRYFPSKLTQLVAAKLEQDSDLPPPLQPSSALPVILPVCSLGGFQEPRALRLAISAGREPRTAGTAASRTSSGPRCCMANCQGSVSILWTRFFAWKT